jgi:hypothetical protein
MVAGVGPGLECGEALGSAHAGVEQSPAPVFVEQRADVDGAAGLGEGHRNTDAVHPHPGEERLVDPEGLSVHEVAALLRGFDRRLELGQHLEQVAHHPVVGHLEDGRVGIFVDGDDGPRALHSGHVLNGP